MECLMCNEECTSFKTNSHILPRFIIKQSKENGKNTLIGLDSGEVIKNNQNDFKADFICDKCEASFNTIETPASKILYNRENIKKDIAQSQDCYYFEKDSFVILWKLVISVILKYHIATKVLKNQDLLGDLHFNKLKNLINIDNNKITRDILKQYPLIIGAILQPKEKTFSAMHPNKHRIKNEIGCFYNFSGLGYTFTLAISSAPINFIETNSALSSATLYIIPIDTILSNKSDLAAIVKTLKRHHQNNIKKLSP